MYTRCRAPARDAARTRFRAFSSSPLLLPAQCTMICAPSTAASIPSPVARSPVTNSIPSPASRLRLLSTRTLQPASRSRGTTRRPSVPVPPVTRICCIVFPLLFLCTLHASQRLVQGSREHAQMLHPPVCSLSKDGLTIREKEECVQWMEPLEKGTMEKRSSHIASCSVQLPVGCLASC